MKKSFAACLALLAGTCLAIVAGSPAPATAQGGTVEASVKYAGKPVVDTIKVTKDTQQCGTEKKIEKVAVGAGGGLMHAIVSLANGKGATTAKAPKATLDQKGCEFHPPVLGMLPGEIDIMNSDGILHNIHTFSTANPSINKAQPKFKKVMTEKFQKPEIIRVQCDVHTWMLGWIAVMPHPFFGITDDKGTTTIENVPAGKQKIKVWHPVLGEQTKDVEVKAGQTTKVAFELKK
jgi:hypothetical protein